MKTLMRSIILGAALASGAAHAGFADVLDAPAEPTALAAHGLFNGVALAGERLVAVGQRGHIVYSDDGGQAWQLATVPVSSDLTAVSFPSARNGWVVGHDGVVLASRDGGATWSKQLDGRRLGALMLEYYAAHQPTHLSADALAQFQSDLQRFVDEGPDKPFLDVWFRNETTGFVVGAFNLVFRTDDGGATWVPWFDRTQNPHLRHFYAVRGIGEDVYLVGEQGLMQRLDPGTQRFRAVELPYQGTLFGVTGKPGLLVVFGLRGNVWRSRDRGGSWEQVQTQLPLGITAGTIASDGRVVLVSQAGHVLVSGDDAVTFASAPLQQRAPAGAVVAAGPASLVLGGARGLHVEQLPTFEVNHVR